MSLERNFDEISLSASIPEFTTARDSTPESITPRAVDSQSRQTPEPEPIAAEPQHQREGGRILRAIRSIPDLLGRGRNRERRVEQTTPAQSRATGTSTLGRTLRRAAASFSNLRDASINRPPSPPPPPVPPIPQSFQPSAPSHHSDSAAAGQQSDAQPRKATPILPHADRLRLLALGTKSAELSPPPPRRTTPSATLPSMSGAPVSNPEQSDARMSQGRAVSDAAPAPKARQRTERSTVIPERNVDRSRSR